MSGDEEAGKRAGKVHHTHTHIHQLKGDEMLINIRQGERKERKGIRETVTGACESCDGRKGSELLLLWMTMKYGEKRKECTGRT